MKSELILVDLPTIAITKKQMTTKAVSALASFSACRWKFTLSSSSSIWRSEEYLSLALRLMDWSLVAGLLCAQFLGSSPMVHVGEEFWCPSFDALSSEVVRQGLRFSRDAAKWFQPPFSPRAPNFWARWTAGFFSLWIPVGILPLRFPLILPLGCPPRHRRPVHLLAPR